MKILSENASLVFILLIYICCVALSLAGAFQRFGASAETNAWANSLKDSYQKMKQSQAEAKNAHIALQRSRSLARFGVLGSCCWLRQK